MRDLIIQSHRGPYTVHFESLFAGLEDGLGDQEHLVIDARVAELYARPLAKALQGRSVLSIKATEQNKSLDRIPEYAAHFLDKGIKRDHTLVVVGGGIVQDIAAFVASCLLRGVSWCFYPTTLLAQADSCIGSKSSINVGRYKNQAGSFMPPSEIRICVDILDSLTQTELLSGLGEIIKVHIISGWEDTRTLAQDLPFLLTDRALLAKTIHRSLEIKKPLIEMDEFDRKERLIMNFGHTFGHALESATDYRIPHGIAVTIGMDMANTLSLKKGLISKAVFDKIRAILAANFGGFEKTDIPADRFFDALQKDKKNVGWDISLILFRGPGSVFLRRQSMDGEFRQSCEDYFRNRKESGVLV